MVTIDEDVYSNMTIKEENGTIAVTMHINLNGEQNNIVTFNFKDRNLFRECRELFNGSYIKSIMDRPRNIELEIGCTDESEGFIYFELSDDNAKDLSPATYNLTLYPEDEYYTLVSGIASIIERAKKKEKGDLREHQFNYAEYKR